MPEETSPHQYSAFADDRLLATGDLASVARAAKAAVDSGTMNVANILIFDDEFGRVVGIDFRGSDEDLAVRVEAISAGGGAVGSPPGVAPARRGRGRPKLGVVAKEVTLLPRHWAWLRSQRGGASATLRRLVDEARRTHEHRDSVRRAQDATYRFMSATVGDSRGFEEANRALYRGDRERFEAESEGWPSDIRDHARKLAAAAFHQTVDEPEA